MFNNKSTRITRKPNTVTKEGGLAYTYENPRNELISGIATTFLEDKFYESSSNRQTRLLALADQVVADGDIEWLYKLIYLARTQWNVRSVTQLMLGHLLANHSDKLNSELTSRYVSKSWKRPDDMLNSVNYVLGKNGGKKGLSQAVRKSANKKLNSMSRFNFAKYKSNTDKRELTFRDLIKITHPKPKNAEQAQLFKMILEDTLDVKDDNWRKTVSTKGATAEVWTEAQKKMGVFGILNNLNAMKRAGTDMTNAIATLTNREAIKKSGLLPFRFMTAMKVVQDLTLRKALKKALIHSVDNVKMPADAKILIAVDTSASMTWNETSAGLVPLDHASMFGAILTKKAEQVNSIVDLIAWASSAEHIATFDKGVFAIAAGFVEGRVGHGTEIANVYVQMNHAKRSGHEYDYVFILTDMQFASVSRYGDVGDNGKSTIIYVNLVGYDNTQNSFTKNNGVIELSGLSEKMFDFLEVSGDPEGAIKLINAVDINKAK